MKAVIRAELFDGTTGRMLRVAPPSAYLSYLFPTERFPPTPCRKDGWFRFLI